jgi:NADPH:quinone reductase-like Zn-dependent oxidoreductase
VKEFRRIRRNLYRKRKSFSQASTRGTLRGKTLPRSVASCAPGGHIALAAALGAGTIPAPVLGAAVTIRRFYGGSRAGLEAMLNAVWMHRLRPVIAAAFSFDEAHEAYRHLAAGGHFGKIVIGG